MKSWRWHYRGLIGALLITLVVGGGHAAEASACNPERGALIAKKCVACHVVGGAEHKVGPGLLGVVGRKAASNPGFRYSRALNALDVVWTPENLDQFLRSPQKYAPGTVMAFGGVKNDEDRADLICFLTEKK